MANQRAGAWTLILFAIVTIPLMAIHPAHLDRAPWFGAIGLFQFVHFPMVIAHVLSIYGFWTLVQFLGCDRPSVSIGFIFAALGAVAMLNSGIVNTYMTTAALRAIEINAHGSSTWEAATRSAVALNRGFAQIYVCFTAIALLAWGTALAGRSRLLAAGGALIAFVLLSWQISGRFDPNTHTMPVVALALGLWVAGAGVMILRRPQRDERGTADPTNVANPGF